MNYVKYTERCVSVAIWRCMKIYDYDNKDGPIRKKAISQDIWVPIHYKILIFTKKNPF